MTREEAIKRLNNLHYKIIHTSFCNKVYEAEIQALVMAKEVLEQPKADKWITCEAEMPKEDYTTCWVAVSESEEDENFYYTSAVYTNNEGFRTNDIEAHGKIVAWQKVQPYKKEGNSNENT